MTVEKVTVEVMVDKDSPVLVVPTDHWRTLVWLHAELAWKFGQHGHEQVDGRHTVNEPWIPHWL